MTLQADTWHVKLANGETRALSLDELDTGFHDGWINERTMVLAAGSTRWAPLGEVAGLDETPAPVASTPNSIAPFALDSFDIDVALDSSSGADLVAFRPRRGRTVLKVMTALVVIGGLGFAGFLGRPAVQRALASRGHASSVTADAKVTPTPPAPVAAPAPSPAPADAVPTLGAASLPNAAPLTDAEKKAAAEAEKKAAAEAKKAKRAAQKRAK
ncbi:MAG: hypothetical protein JWO86_2509 [Myxococcaceae bacterium]|nr:hypothetical protein [Myxococcaceae bacterium]